ncbi:MAG: stage II sporulation protein P [Clostridiales bacterium]|nr:stage II sporulation protein P [Clostridiales bacterium]
MMKKRRVYKKPGTLKFRLQLFLFAASLLFFLSVYVINQQEKNPLSADKKLETLYNASSVKLDTPDGLPYLKENESENSIDDSAEHESSLPLEISESSVTTSDLQLMQQRHPITGITIKSDDSTDSKIITMKNETGYNPDIDALLRTGPSLTLSDKGPQVLIYHTHTSEAYSPNGQDTYTPDDNDRTLDKRYSVVRVGDEIEKILNKKGIKTIHYEDGYFDYPSYTGSYTRSMKAISEQLKKYPSIKVVIDLHRDAMISSTGIKYKTETTINGKKAAQIMLVCGTDEGGLSHKDWRQNLAFDVTLQRDLLKKYPTLMRPINLRSERFNQNVRPCATLIEIGTSGNTLEEAVYSASLLADTMADTLKRYKK